ncbi:MAG: MFS transporter [Syntrophobacteraceae bacterium]
MNKLPKGILVLGFVSFFTDLSSEMIYPLLPVFLSSVLGAGALALGLIEGTAESTASFFKVLSGYSTDRTERRKPFIIAGYGMSGLARPLIAFAAGWPFVLVMRFLDRMGKGIRTSPRDALVADITQRGQRGQRGVAFGLHRAMDHAGAVAGPLVAAAMLGFAALSLRHVFFLAAIPSVLVMAIILFFVKEPAPKAIKIDRPLNIYSQWKHLGRSFKYFLAAMLLFTLGNSTDAFMILRLSNAGISASHIAMLWSAHNVIRMISTYTGGRLADGFGSRKLIISGWIFYALIYAAFAFIRTPNALVAIFLLYGVYVGLSEPAEKSLVADMVAPNLRGTAFGCYHFIVGIGALPASIVFGFLWQTLSAEAAFLTGAALAVAASTLLFLSQKPEVESGMVETGGQVSEIECIRSDVEDRSKQKGRSVGPASRP